MGSYSIDKQTFLMSHFDHLYYIALIVLSYVSNTDVFAGKIEFIFSNIVSLITFCQGWKHNKCGPWNNWIIKWSVHHIILTSQR